MYIDIYFFMQQIIPDTLSLTPDTRNTGGGKNCLKIAGP